jgi:hypothetical protein
VKLIATTVGARAEANRRPYSSECQSSTCSCCKTVMLSLAWKTSEIACRTGRGSFGAARLMLLSFRRYTDYN